MNFKKELSLLLILNIVFLFLNFSGFNMIKNDYTKIEMYKYYDKIENINLFPDKNALNLSFLNGELINNVELFDKNNYILDLNYKYVIIFVLMIIITLEIALRTRKIISKYIIIRK